MNQLKNQLKKRLNVKKIAAIGFLLMFIYVAGCSGTADTEKAGRDPDTAFTVNEQKISMTDFRKRLFKARYVQEAQGTRYQGPADSPMYQQLRDNTINLMVKETLVMQQADKAGVAVPEEEVEKVIQSIKSNFPNEEDFKALMLSRGLDEETMKNYNRMQLTSLALMKKAGSEQQYNALLDSALADAKVERNEEVVTKIVEEISQITSQELLADPGSAI